MALRRNQSSVLAALAANGDELSGLELADIIGSLARSSVYAALSALQRDGLVDARWDFAESHQRRMIPINEGGLVSIAASEKRASEQQMRPRRSSLAGGDV